MPKFHIIKSSELFLLLDQKNKLFLPEEQLAFNEIIFPDQKLFIFNTSELL